MRYTSIGLCALLIANFAPLRAYDEITELGIQTDNLYRVGAASEDGSYTALSSSMLGWGIGLAIGIGILVAVLHSSTAPSPSPSSH